MAFGVRIDLLPRADLLDILRADACGLYSFDVKPAGFRAEMRNDATGDWYDAVLCAIQAASAWTQRHQRQRHDTLEGWIAGPGLREAWEGISTPPLPGAAGKRVVI